MHCRIVRIIQRSGDPVEIFISCFKKMRNMYKIHLPEMEYVKMTQKGLDVELMKKFQGMDFKDFYELIAKIAKYEELLMKETK